ncbi:hypothetical protein VE03_06121 [Pseudogymnoascus sp. 23342-1-I1]|nr:hypothetical protein VE03_06121 [Pseudogymnoascus sp. 23342-1-I1]
MVVPIVSANEVAKSSTLIDYVQFDQWKITDCFSDEKYFKVSASYAMGILFNRLKGAYRASDGKMIGLVDIAPSFFSSVNKVRAGCESYGHGIVVEGRWVTYDEKTMRGSSMRPLPTGQSFASLCKEQTFQLWFTKVLNGHYKGYDIDTLPLDILISLTSPNSPGSLASENPAGLSPSFGPSIHNDQATAPAKRDAAKARSETAPILSQVTTRSQQGAGRITLKFRPIHNKLIEGLDHQGTAASTSPTPTNSPAVPTKTAKAGEARLSIRNNDQTVTNQALSPTRHRLSLGHSPNQSAAISPEQNGTPVQGDSQLPDQTTAGPMAATQSSDNVATSKKRHNASPLASSLDKRTKISPAHQQQGIIDVSSGDEENVNVTHDNSQPSSNATQNQTLMKEIARLKMSESRAVDRTNETMAKFEKLMQENTNLKLSEMRAVNRGNEALEKLRAANRAIELANRANEVLGGNEDLVGRFEELMRENASLKLLVLRSDGRTGETMGKYNGLSSGNKNEGTTQQIKKENFAGQRNEQT